MIKYILGIVLLSLLSACTTVKSTTGERIRSRSTRYLVQKLKKNELQYNWFYAKGKLGIKSEKEAISLSAKIAVQRDTLIWMSFKKVNVEGMRVRITPALIEILDRQQRKYYLMAFSALEQEYNIDLSFRELQDVLVGNPLRYEEKGLKSSVDSVGYSLETSTSANQSIQLKIDPQEFFLNFLQASSQEHFVEIDYTDHIDLEGVKIAKKKRILVQSDQTGKTTFKLNLRKIELNNAPKVGFKVPSSYEKIEN